jgi:hypothetical protein
MILPKAFALGVQFITLVAGADRVPELNIVPVCKGIAQQGGVTFHDPAIPQEQKNCIESERAVREQLIKQWSSFLVDDRTHCISETTMGGESSYTELLTCLEMARDVRVMRAEASAPSRKSTTRASSSPTPARPAPPETSPVRASANPTPPSPPTPTLPPTLTLPPSTSPSTSVDERSNFELASTRKELELAKADAQSATVSEVSAQRKLADTEAALERTKEEAERATDEAQRAKDDAQAARESEATEKRKLADAEAARTTAEKQCQAERRQPDFGERLREWFHNE